MSMLGTSEIYDLKRKRLEHDTFKFPFMMGADLSWTLFSKGSTLSFCSYLYSNMYRFSYPLHLKEELASGQFPFEWAVLSSMV